jgi:membrane protease YdiL (CAAX protease family)
VQPALWLTGDLSSVLAGFLAAGITVAGFLAFGWRWCAPYVLIASAVALVLLLAPDSYATFGLIFLVGVSTAGIRLVKHPPRLSRVRQQPLVAYFALAFGISWAAILWLIAPTGLPGTGNDYLVRGPLVFLAMLLGPSLAGLILTFSLDRGQGLVDLWARERRWRVGRWWMAVLLTPAVVVAIGALGWIAPELTLGALTASDKVVLVSFALVVGLGAGLIEEIGWTGFVVPRLERYGWLRAGLVLGVLWAMASSCRLLGQRRSVGRAVCAALSALVRRRVHGLPHPDGVGVSPHAQSPARAIDAREFHRRPGAPYASAVAVGQWDRVVRGLRRRTLARGRPGRPD